MLGADLEACGLLQKPEESRFLIGLHPWLTCSVPLFQRIPGVLPILSILSGLHSVLLQAQESHGNPWVRVPVLSKVLSKVLTSTLAMRSRASPDLMRTP